MIRKTIRRVPLIAAAGVGVFLAHGAATAEPERRPDPVEVQRFLTEMEAGTAAAAQPSTALRMIEGAAARAPSAPMLDSVEKSVAKSLG